MSKPEKLLPSFLRRFRSPESSTPPLNSPEKVVRSVFQKFEQTRTVVSQAEVRKLCRRSKLTAEEEAQVLTQLQNGFAQRIKKQLAFATKLNSPLLEVDYQYPLGITEWVPMQLIALLTFDRAAEIAKTYYQNTIDSLDISDAKLAQVIHQLGTWRGGRATEIPFALYIYGRFYTLFSEAIVASQSEEQLDNLAHQIELFEQAKRITCYEVSSLKISIQEQRAKLPRVYQQNHAPNGVGEGQGVEVTSPPEK
jgi:hypothetical protein